MDQDQQVKLTDEQRRRAQGIISTTPTVALPNGGLGRPVGTVDELIDHLETMRDALQRYIRETMDLRDQRELEARDLAAVGRVLARIQAAYP